MIKKILRNGELPLFQNTDNTPVRLFNPQDDDEVISKKQSQFFIPSYKVSMDTVEKWINKYSTVNPLEANSILLITEDQGDAPRYGGAIWFKQSENT
jgi:hypothetical protein